MSDAFLSMKAASRQCPLVRPTIRYLCLFRLKLQLDRLERWRGWEADAETVIELCGEEEGEDEETAAMLDEAMEVRRRYVT